MKKKKFKANRKTNSKVKHKRKKPPDEGLWAQKAAFIFTFCALFSIIGMAEAYSNTRALGFGEETVLVSYQATEDKIGLRAGESEIILEREALDQALEPVEKAATAIPASIRLMWYALESVPEGLHELLDHGIDWNRLFGRRQL